MHRLLLPLAAVALLVGCDSVSEPASEPAPPPAAAFALDADLLDNGARLAAGEHFLNAAGRYVVVSAVIGVNLAIPAAVTAEATRAEPFVEDGTWIWERTSRIDASDVTFRLEGTPDGQTVDWRLRIVAVDGETGRIEEDLDLYTATTSLDGRRGDWRLHYVIDGAPATVLTADFEVRAEDDREITFRVPEGRDAGGSSVLYRVDGPSQVFDWLRQPEDVRTRVEWDRETLVGFLEADDYNDGARSCWDADLDDAACPNA